LWLSVFAFAQQYHRTDLTANMSSVSPSTPRINVEPHLVNAWGLARGTSTAWWVSDKGTGLSTLYNAVGMPQSLVVKILTPDGKGTFAPTGLFSIPPWHFPWHRT
jgi:hypothetical protein